MGVGERATPRSGTGPAGLKPKRSSLGWALAPTMTARLRSIGLAVALLTVFLTPGCSTAAKCAGQQAWKGADGVCNTEGHFAYGGEKSNLTETETHDWTNPQSRAEVNWGGKGSGNLSVTIRDANGTEVYSEVFDGGQGAGSETTSAGAPGEWTIELAFEDFEGKVALSIQATNGTGG